MSHNDIETEYYNGCDEGKCDSNEENRSEDNQVNNYDNYYL